MQEDFHYYATYAAAVLAGYSHDESLQICYSANLVDSCSRTFLERIGAPHSAATTQLQLEMMKARLDRIGLQDITRIWASFHFLPGDLYAPVFHGFRMYRNKYRLICQPNSLLMEETVHLALSKGPEAAGLAMHVLCDTWAHRNFAGTPSLVINNVSNQIWEWVPREDTLFRKPIHFRHNPALPDNPEEGIYNCTLFQIPENSIMNLAHGRAGHLPDYSFIRYSYMPAWGDYSIITKDNPSDYRHAFAQMVQALQYLRGTQDHFRRDQYAWDVLSPHDDRIRSILTRRQTDASRDWQAFGESLSGEHIPPFDLERYQKEYREASDREDTFLGRFIHAAQAQKSMVVNAISSSGNPLAGSLVRRKPFGRFPHPTPGMFREAGS